MENYTNILKQTFGDTEIFRADVKKVRTVLIDLLTCVKESESGIVSLKDVGCVLSFLNDLEETIVI